MPFLLFHAPFPLYMRWKHNLLQDMAATVLDIWFDHVIV
jgi:hypothetical protein